MEMLLKGLEQMLDSMWHAIPKIILGFVILGIGSYLVKLILKMIRRRLEKREVELSLRGFLLSVVKATLYIILLIVVAATMGFQVAGIATIFASAGLAVGLALQGSLSNFAGGVLVLLFKPFKVGDYISNPSGTEGTVERIDLLYTTLTGPTGLKVFSPNGPLANSVITNYSEITSRRHDFVVGIGYNENIKEAQNIILATLAKHKAVLQNPAPIVFVSSLGDSSVDLNVRTWIGKSDYWNTVFEIQQIVKVALDEANIEIPFPQRDLHIVSDKTK
ncbi:mechanosensitive ion channel family protein [Myroides sp. 1354]|uniref:mechanosensitive ion channel family protein n=1 Tax=unclassified Myroides TaxID=2642485 RepID=UPI0025763A7A|nr:MULTISPECIES: mechanosensitive ion channel family protein [unclassified Myroides]MDM1044062.1 mechanosensitive ion channel family protein [Myroides sp. R163-1]MDM1054997.1 mechanosensitive ion channel family protein [Myroides sp. 1354]MDM1068294.1 mechanosensitive ion channel family protein [Myroides sp. 1372]